MLSDENRALLRLMQEKQPRTALELAELSGRAASNLSRTPRNLEGYGLVKLTRLGSDDISGSSRSSLRRLREA